ALEDKYGRDLRVVYKQNPLPFHPHAMPAANATECAREQGKFWEMHDMIFQNQQAMEDTDFERYAKSVGADVNRWKACYQSQKYKARIEEDTRVSAQLGARGTPAFFINGRFLSGAQPQPAFEAIIDEELKKAKESGLNKREYYEKAVVEKGKKAM